MIGKPIQTENAIPINIVPQLVCVQMYSAVHTRRAFLKAKTNAKTSQIIRSTKIVKQNERLTGDA